MGAPHHTPCQRTYLLKNWKYKTDEELSIDMQLANEESATKLRLSMGLKRSRIPVKDPKRIAFICEQFCSGVTIKTISKLVGKKENQVSKVLSDHWFTKKVSENTITITLTSSV